MYDLIIIGAGPAGITASVYAARQRMNFLVLTKDIGGQAALSGDVENYTGYQFITGPELATKFEQHMRQYGITVKEDEEVKEIKRRESRILVDTHKGTYEARTAIIASGKRSKQLNVPGEKEFKNRGLTYCATCDGPLFAAKVVAVIGGGNSALDATMQLANIAQHIYLIDLAPQLKGDVIIQEKIKKNNKISIFNNTQVTAILGDKMVNGLRIKTGQEEKTIAVGGVFVEIGLIPNSDFAPEISKNERGEIKVNCRNETNIPGILAAGDVTDVPEKQVIVAAGEGAKAALSAFRYISQTK